MFSILISSITSITGIFSNKSFVKYGIIVLILVSITGYIVFLKYSINTKNTVIVNLDNNLTVLNLKYNTDKNIWTINRLTLEGTITDQSNKIDKFKLDEVNNLKVYNNNVNKNNIRYITKIIEANDSNASEVIEYKAFKTFVNEEIN